MHCLTAKKSCLFLAATLTFVPGSDAAAPVLAEPTEEGLTLEWNWPTDVADDGLTHSVVEIQRSGDMGDWTGLGSLRGPVGGGGFEQVEVALADGAETGFFRVRQSEQRALALDGGAEVFGFGRAFERAMEGIGFPSVDEFAAVHPAPDYLASVSFNPTQAEYFGSLGSLPYISFNLSPAEQSLYQQNGFVVTEQPTGTVTNFDGFTRTLATDFKGHYLSIFRNDLPVFISADSMLNAWHRSMEPMLEELEEAALSEALRDLLGGMRAQIAQMDAEGVSADPFWGTRLRDLDVYLGVANRLLGQGIVFDPSTPPELDLLYFEITGEYEEEEIKSFRESLEFPVMEKPLLMGYYESVYGPEVVPALSEWFDATVAARWRADPGPDPATILDQDAEVEGWLGYIRSEAFVRVDGRDYDFSTYRPRGHYTNSANLSAYFQAMTWCGQQDFRVVDPSRADNGRRDLANAILLNFVLEESGRFELWEHFESLLTGLIGPADSMTPGQLKDLLTAAGINGLGDLSDDTELAAFQNELLSGELGMQQITGHPMTSPRSTEPGILPRSCTFIGQRFTFGSWAFGEMTFDDIRWPVDIPGKVAFGKVLRRMPSALDVAYGVLGNDHVGPVIAERMAAVDGVPFRDGLPYQHNLLAVRQVVDDIDPGTWGASVYAHWLHTLRALSAPLNDPRLPQAMRTRAWGMKTTTGQLASWTQLRHAFVLYAKPSFTDRFLCEYPYGYVEPVPEFWARLAAMADFLADLTADLNITGSTSIVRDVISDDFAYLEFHVDIADLLDTQEAHLRGFADRATQLGVMAEKELNGQSFSGAEWALIDTLITANDYDLTFGGWYPQLYYAPVFAEPEHLDLDYREPLAVVDVHTDQPDPMVGDPGGVLHAGVGRADLLLIAIDQPDGCKRLYAGPVYNFYEFVEPSGSRLNDEEWAARWEDPTTRPPSPEWTAVYREP